MLIVGERINSTRKPIELALKAGDLDLLFKEATSQWEAGVGYLDVNTATMMKDEEEWMTRVVNMIQEAIPESLISVDSPNEKAVEAGLQAHRGRPLLNSISGEQRRIDALLPLIRDYKPRVIGLTIDDGGIHSDAQKRFDIAARLIELIGEQGIEHDDIFIDPLVFPVAAADNAGKIALDIMAKIRDAYPGVHTICGLSNVSFGAPVRKILNQSYMVMAMTRGLDAVIVDPLDRRLMANIFAADMLLGEDPGCRRYIAAYRAGKLNLDGDPSQPGTQAV